MKVALSLIVAGFVGLLFGAAALADNTLKCWKPSTPCGSYVCAANVYKSGWCTTIYYPEVGGQCYPGGTGCSMESNTCEIQSWDDPPSGCRCSGLPGDVQSSTVSYCT